MSILEMRHISKSFPGVKALDDVNIKLEKGEIHALVGENGAGKSTLMNILSGIYPYGDYTGEIIFNGDECRFNNIHESEEKGIVIIHQELALVPYLSIAENMFLGNEQGGKFSIDWDKTFSTAKKWLNVVGLDENPDTLIKDIGVGKQQLVEIAKALSKNVTLLILDEPTASLNENDSEKLLELMVRLKSDGISSIIISHKLNEISAVSDRITILRDGSTIETLVKGKDDYSENRIIKGMVGREISDRFPHRDTKIGEIMMEIKHWTVMHPLDSERKICDDVSLNVRKGEVIGISGLMGAGRTELAMSVFGRSYGIYDSGKVIINGKEVVLKKTGKAIKAGLAYVTEDRKGNGLILDSSIKTNTTLANLSEVSRNLRVDDDKETFAAELYRRKLNTKAPSVEVHARNLSGGNQQKVLLSKWMFTNPDILILDEPTRGIDVGAKYEIYNIINKLAEEGKSVILISSELPEVLGMSDRIYVMNEGRVVGELKKNEATQDKIMGIILQSS